MPKDTRIVSLSISAYSYESPNGNFTITGEGFTSNISMTEDECREIANLAFGFFEARQKSIGDSIANAKLPNLLSGPVQDADFEEVSV